MGKSGSGRRTGGWCRLLEGHVPVHGFNIIRQYHPCSVGVYCECLLNFEFYFMYRDCSETSELEVVGVLGELNTN